MRAGRLVARGSAFGLATALALTGCQGGPAAKTGENTVGLVFGTVGTLPNADTGLSRALDLFVRQVAALSGGHVRIVVDSGVGNGAAGSEQELIKEVQNGNLAGAWNPTRGFAAAGIHAFEAAEAPFVLQGYPAEQQFVTGPIAKRMLNRLGTSGLVGLGMLAGPLRRPFALHAALVSPAGWKGLSFRIENTPEQLGTLAALGARPAVTDSAGVSSAIVTAGGQEFDLFQYDYDGFGSAEPYVTDNLALWPKPFVLMMNAARFKALTSQQRQWLTEAAQQAVHASATAAFDETPAAQRLCLAGVRFTDVTPGQLADLREAVSPVYEHLRADAGTAADLADLQGIAAAHPNASAASIPAGCRGAAAAPATVDTSITTLPQVPDGVYRVSFTKEDFEKLGAEPGHAADNAGTATMEISHGTYAIRIIFAGGPGVFIVDAGDVRGTGTLIVFEPDKARLTRLGGCLEGCVPMQTPYSFDFTFFGDMLTLSDAKGLTDPISLGTDISHPWRRISG